MELVEKIEKELREDQIENELDYFIFHKKKI